MLELISLVTRSLLHEQPHMNNMPNEMHIIMRVKVEINVRLIGKVLSNAHHVTLFPATLQL